MSTRRLDSWFRHVVPNGYATGTIDIEGLSPLLMNSPEADRDGDLFRAFTLLSQKPGKTFDDEAQLRRLEWEVRIYFDDELGPYLPGRMLKAVLIEAAGKFKKGATIKRSLTTALYRIPLQYTGPRDQDGLWAQEHRFTTMVQNAGFGSGRVMRTRPMFPEWGLSVGIAFDPEEIDPKTLAAIVERSQRYGLGDYRPAKSGGDFGMFAANLTIDSTSRKAREALGSKTRNGHEAAAHAVALDQLTPLEVG